jgi:peptidoglycan hydrolase-like protein with peptidoglycan-binding domain
VSKPATPQVSRSGAARRAVAPAVALLASAVVLLSACGSSGSGGASPTTSAATSTTATSTSTSTSTTATTTTTTSTTAAPAPTTTTSTTTTTTAPPPEEQAEPPGPLQSGAVGKRTEALQAALKAQAYDPGEPDGRFGLKTTMAVWAWQALHGLPADGVVTPQQEALILAAPAQQMLRPALGPTHTEIDLTRQVILVWKSGRLVLVSHVSSGSQVPYCEDGHCGNAVTPVGTYHYNRRVDGWRNAPLGHLYNPVYFVGGIAVHGAPSVPNHPASHGCVRIPMHIAEYFPSLVAKGDPVETFRS